jgi:hypothetical protein
MFKKANNNLKCLNLKNQAALNSAGYSPSQYFSLLPSKFIWPPEVINKTTTILYSDVLKEARFSPHCMQAKL